MLQTTSSLAVLQQPSSSGDLVSQAPSLFLEGCVVEQHPEVLPSCKGDSDVIDFGPQHPFLGD